MDDFLRWMTMWSIQSAYPGVTGTSKPVVAGERLSSSPRVTINKSGRLDEQLVVDRATSPSAGQ